MDGIAAVRSYIDRLVTGDGRCSGMKVLLLDATTTQIISSVYSQSEILQKEVYLVSRIDDNKSNPYLQNSETIRNEKDGTLVGGTSHLKAICFLRPTEINAGLLVRELSSRHSRFCEYHIFFNGIVRSMILRLLSENDEYEKVKQIQEFYVDFLSINKELFSLNCRNTLVMTMSAGTSWARDHAPLYSRTREGLASMLLALKRQPSAIRYQRSSVLCKQLALNIEESIKADQIFHFRKKNNFVLLIIDRCDDPVTPLLSQWTYQAMVHELLGLNNNRVLLRGAPGIKKELEEVVLSSSQDDFFRENLHANFGELGESIKKMLDDYQKQTNLNNSIRSNLNSIEEMQAFMEKFPEIRSKSYNVSKHVAIMGELARLVDVCSLLDVSQFEQELACTDDHATHLRELLEKLSSPHVKEPDKLRLGLLYSIRYENDGFITKVKDAMLTGGVSRENVQLVDILLRYSGSRVRGPGLFGSHDVISKMTKNFMSSVQGVSNVYAQHVPLLIDTLQAMAKIRLKESSHPFLSSSVDRTKTPQEILVFMLGGVTYEETTKVHEFNQSNAQGIKVILSGSTIHNSTSFLDELKNL